MQERGSVLTGWLSRFRSNTLQDGNLSLFTVIERIKLANLLTRADTELHGVAFKEERGVQVKQKTTTSPSFKNFLENS
jgi:hypothetical protein